MISKKGIRESLPKKRFNPINGDPDNWGESTISSDGNTLSTRIPTILLKYFKAGETLHWEKDDLLESRFIIHNLRNEKKSKLIPYTKTAEEEKKLISNYCNQIAKKIGNAKKIHVQEGYLEGLGPHTNSNTLREIKNKIKLGASNRDEIRNYLENEIEKHKIKEKQLENQNKKHKELHDQRVNLLRRKEIEDEKRDFDILKKAVPKTNKPALEIVNRLKKRLGIE